MMLGSFMLFVLFLTGAIASGIQMFGPDANINNQCQLYVDSKKSFGATMETLAWMEQSNICE